jgi:Skp family chaperone for outer membrane proteins
MAIRFLPADDIFISYPRQGASTYASGLADELAKRGFSPFIDKFDTKPSPVLTEELRRKIRECKMLVIIGTRRAGSRPIIEQEIREYLETGRRSIVPIDFNNATHKARWFPLIEGVALEPEPRVKALQDGNPSESVLNRIEKQFTYRRTKERQRRTTTTLAALSLFFTLVSVAAGLYAAAQVAAATRAAAEAEQARGDAVKARGELDTAKAERTAAQLERDNARTEAETARSEAKDARTQADIAKGEAEKQQKAADAARRRAEAAVDLQRQAEKQTRESVAESMVTTGYATLQAAPAVAVNLAFAAAGLSDSAAQPTALLNEALRNNPIWFQYIPAGAAPNRPFFLPPRPLPNDLLAADPNFTRVLSVPDVKGKAGAPNLALVEVPTGTVLSKLALSEKEELLTPEPLGTRLFVVRAKENAAGVLKVYDLSGPGIEKPVLTLDQARSIECTGGDWPCYVLTGSGEVFSYGVPGQGAPPDAVRVGRWDDALSLSAHPRGGALVVIRAGSISWVAFNDRCGVEARSDIPVSPPAIVERAGKYKIKWGPERNNLLLARNVIEKDLKNRFTIEAINGATKNIQEVYRHEAFLFTPAWMFETARGGRRFIVGGDRGTTDVMTRNYLKVIDLTWQDDGHGPVVNVTGQYSLDVSCTTNSYSQIERATISPNGNYLVTVRSEFGKSGTTTRVGLLEQWDVSALDYKGSTLKPVSVELTIRRTPVTRVAYSADSSRLLIWDAGERISIFRLRPEPPDLFGQSVRMPREWENVTLNKQASPAAFTNVPLPEAIKERYQKWIR